MSGSESNIPVSSAASSISPAPHNHLVSVRNCTLGDFPPKICVPVVGAALEEFIENARLALSAHPDLIELRLDTLTHFSIETNEHFVSTLRKKLETDIPVLVTVRSERDGGSFPAEQYDSVLEKLISDGDADAIDVEYSAGKSSFEQLANQAKAAGIPVVGSWHNFHLTPSKNELLSILDGMSAFGADIAKIAVMPKTVADVDTLEEVAEEAWSMLPCPVICISMGHLGQRSRTEYDRFHSCLTFATAGSASAPGQISVAQLRHIWDTHDDSI